MPFEESASRIWRQLSPEDRTCAAAAYWAHPGEDAGTAVLKIASARRLRPQVARRLDDEAKARILATVRDPGEPLAFSLLVALHVDQRREMLVTFLDAAGLTHEDGVLAEDDAQSPLTLEGAGAGVRAISGRFDPSEVACYLNTLWLQDPERWAAVETAYEALPSSANSPSGSDSRGGSSNQ